MNTVPTHHALMVSADHPSLAGHFPGNPIVPGVVILDAVLAAVQAHVGADWRLQRLPQIKFLQPLLPAQTANIELTAVASSANQQRLRFRVVRDNDLLSSGELLLAPATAAT